MDFEPQKLFVGLMDFFFVLLPGALLTFLLEDGASKSPFIADKLRQLGGLKGWLAFHVRRS